MKYTTQIIRTRRLPRPTEPTLPGGVRLPQVIGPQRSFGFGDRLGRATAGHLKAWGNQSGFMPIFAQQSVPEMARSGRTLKEVMDAAVGALGKAHYKQPWGADADHLRTPSDVEQAAAAGFTHFTIDASEHINNDAHLLSPEGLAAALERLTTDGEILPERESVYLDGPIDVPNAGPVRYEPDALRRIMVKFGRALAFCERMAAAVARACPNRPYEIELAVDEARAATTLAEHLYLGLELEARRVRIVAFAPRMPPGFEPGDDFRGDVGAFETFLREHAAVAAFCGPYKVSIHGGSDKLSVYPAIGRICGDLLHVKTGGASYLEALRVVLRTNTKLFEEIAQFCHARFEIDRAGYRISTSTQEARELADSLPEDREVLYLDTRVGRQLLHVTYGSVLTAGRVQDGRSFKEAILETLEVSADLYTERIAAYFSEHLRRLLEG